MIFQEGILQELLDAGGKGHALLERPTPFACALLKGFKLVLTVCIMPEARVEAKAQEDPWRLGLFRVSWQKS